MVRAPCCEKEGVKKGPWTPEEDQLLVAYIQQHGHDNWRKLPKKAGLARCGKSCRLRWTNYLRPDIKRGNFTKEEENAIIQLHQQLGNRWSSIAAKLPGRTDNEIKNVWHTHLKKKIAGYKAGGGAQQRKIRKVRSKTAATDNNNNKKKHKDDACMPTKPQAIRLEAAVGPGPVQQQPAVAAAVAVHKCSTSPLEGPASPSNSFCSVSSSSSSSSSSVYDPADASYTEGLIDSLDALLEVDIDENFWSDALSLDSSASSGIDHTTTDWTTSTTISSSCLTSLPSPFDDSTVANCIGGGDDVEMGYWLKVFMEAADMVQDFY